MLRDRHGWMPWMNYYRLSIINYQGYRAIASSTLTTAAPQHPHRLHQLNTKLATMSQSYRTLSNPLRQALVVSHIARPIAGCFLTLSPTLLTAIPSINLAPIYTLPAYSPNILFGIRIIITLNLNLSSYADHRCPCSRFLNSRRGGTLGAGNAKSQRDDA